MLSKGLLKAVASVILHEKTTLIVNKGESQGKEGDSEPEDRTKSTAVTSGHSRQS